jgi:hypothetical protein
MSLESKYEAMADTFSEAVRAPVYLGRQGKESRPILNRISTFWRNQIANGN